MYTCGCKGIPEKSLREELEKVSGPVDRKKQIALHLELGGKGGSCCGGCRLPDGNRFFAEIIREHNAQFDDTEKDVNEKLPPASPPPSPL